jgi:hypothetical protein
MTNLTTWVKPFHLTVMLSAVLKTEHFGQPDMMEDDATADPGIDSEEEEEQVAAAQAAELESGWEPRREGDATIPGQDGQAEEPIKLVKVTRPGIEPRTFWTYTRCSNQLSYLALESNQLILYLCNCQPKDTYSARHI